MRTKNKIRFAIIGFGHIGKKHAHMIIGNRDCELVAICDSNPHAASDTSYKSILFFSSAETLFNSGIAFDVLCVATPNGFHEEHALMGIRHGHHVVLEKPMALTKVGCELIIFEALHHHKRVFCIMQNRYSPPSQWLKEIVSKNILGHIGMVQINCYWNRDERYYKKGDWHGTKNLDGGTLFTQFSHFIDIMYWVFGDIQNINSRLCNFSHKGLIDFEDSGFVSFDFVKGGIGSINYSTSAWDSNLESSIIVIGETGTVKIGGQYMNSVEYCNIKDYSMPDLPMSNPPNDYGQYKGSAANHHFIFENVVEVLNSKAPITTNAYEGMKVVEIIEKIYSSKK